MIGSGPLFALLLLVNSPAVGSQPPPAPVTKDPPVQQIAPAPQSLDTAAAQPEISYVDGQLTIRALNARLSDVLAKVSSLTGVPVETPDGPNNEVIPRLQLGPGSARQVLSSLLDDSQLDYVIQQSDSDPDKLQNVLVMRRGNRKSAPGVDDGPVRASSGSYPATVASPLISDNSNELTAEASDPTPPPSSKPPATDVLAAQRAQSEATKPPTLSPAAMTPQNVSQQLQQMYQQRMQMVQQARQTSQFTQ